ncbi:hypothetical protein Hanom_Chr14g01322221 [Helianthus anomalus]
MLLEEPKSLLREKGIQLMKDQASADNLVYSYLKDAVETVEENMETSEKEVGKIMSPK